MMKKEGLAGWMYDVSRGLSIGWMGGQKCDTHQLVMMMMMMVMMMMMMMMMTTMMMMMMKRERLA